MSRAAEQWLELIACTDARRVCGAFGVGFPPPETSADVATVCALCDLGVAFAPIVAEPRPEPRKVKARYRWEEDREVVDLAPRWRHAVTGAHGERGAEAFIVPVGAVEVSWRAADLGCTLSRCQLGDEAFLDSIADLIAIPLDGGRPLSLTGFTIAVGTFQADDRGRLALFASGKTWLEAHVARAMALSADTPAHLIVQLVMPFPSAQGILLVEPEALDWRVTSPACVIPADVETLVCVDSAGLAARIDQLAHKRERTRPVPNILAPKPSEAAA